MEYGIEIKDIELTIIFIFLEDLARFMIEKKIDENITVVPGRVY